MTEFQSASVSPLVPAQRNSASSTYVDYLFDDTYFEEKLKERIETVAIDLLLRQYFSENSVTDDPFDSIYISRLSPDPIQTRTINDLSQFKNIADKSHEIVFIDDLEV